MIPEDLFDFVLIGAGVLILCVTQLFQNLATENSYIAALTQLGSQIQAALSNNQDATVLVNQYQSNMSLVSQISSQNAALESQIKLELDAAGVNITIGESDIQSFLQSIVTNGFPPQELTLFSELGVSPSDILNALLALDLSGVPLSLDGVFDDAISTETAIADATGATGTNRAPQASACAIIFKHVC